METKVKNPETGHWIKIGGPRYNRLVQEKKIHPSPDLPTRTVPVFTPPKTYRVSQKQQSEYKTDFSTTTSWKDKAPMKKSERQTVRKTCGESCFLLPDELKFPVCNKKVPPCEYNCKGLKAASSAAARLHYPKVLQQSKRRTEKHGCYTTTFPKKG